MVALSALSLCRLLSTSPWISRPTILAIAFRSRVPRASGMADDGSVSAASEFLLYTAPNGEVRIQVLLQGEGNARVGAHHPRAVALGSRSLSCGGRGIGAVGHRWQGTRARETRAGLSAVNDATSPVQGSGSQAP